MIRRYSILTWDPEHDDWTPQVGLGVPSLGCTLDELMPALEQCRVLGYDCDPFDPEQLWLTEDEPCVLSPFMVIVEVHPNLIPMVAE